MPTITINIAAAGTARDKSTPSAAGHMWFDLNDGKGTEESSKSFGWGPDESKPFAVRADVIDNDSATYKDKSYSRTINISQAQYESIYAFADNPGAHGFTSDYNAVTHSCIDYVWRALAAGGLNPGNYEGRIWPPSNAERIASIPDVYADHWSDAAAEAFVNELFQHSQDLATELWKARLLTVTADGNRKIGRAHV